MDIKRSPCLEWRSLCSPSLIHLQNDRPGHNVCSAYAVEHKANVIVVTVASHGHVDERHRYLSVTPPTAWWTACSRFMSCQYC